MWNGHETDFVVWHHELSYVVHEYYTTVWHEIEARGFSNSIWAINYCIYAAMIWHWSESQSGPLQRKEYYIPPAEPPLIMKNYECLNTTVRKFAKFWKLSNIQFHLTTIVFTNFYSISQFIEYLYLWSNRISANKRILSNLYRKSKEKTWKCIYIYYTFYWNSMNN